ncbi:hypothetical protein H1R20_g12187, partial [Candolleomyces eurysporus]
MSNSSSESLRRENEDLRSRIGHLTEIVEELKQDKQALRENANHWKEKAAGLKAEMTEEISRKDARIIELEMLLDSARQSTSNLLPSAISSKALGKQKNTDHEVSSSREATALGKRKVDTPSSPPRAIKRYRTLPGHQEPSEPASSAGSAPSCSEALNEDYDAKSGISRPIIKYKEEEAFVLPPDLIAGYLRDAPALEIRPNPSGLHVRRDYLRLLLTGSDMHFFQKVEAKKNPSGSEPRTLVFPRFDLNPAMPLIPGESGLILSKRPEVLKYSPLGLFRRDMSGEEEAVWQYLGEYETKVVGMMTGELFRQQNNKVQRAWAKTILKQKGHQAYRMVKVRISLRKRGLPIPSEAESKKPSDAVTTRGKEKGKKKEAQEDKDQGWGDVDEEDIIVSSLTQKLYRVSK